MTIPPPSAEAVKHTPLPWRLYVDTDTPNMRIEIVAMGKTIAHIYHSVAEQDLPNALLIVEAVNNYDALTTRLARAEEALARVVAMVGGCDCHLDYKDRGMTDPTCVYCNYEIEDAEEALAASKGTGK